MDNKFINQYPFLSNFEKNFEDIPNLLSNFWYNYIHLLKHYVKGDIIKKDYKGMAELIELMMDGKPGVVFEKLMDNISCEQFIKDVGNLKNFKKEKIYNYLMRFTFIVSDLNDFTDQVKKTIGTEVNLGPQKIEDRLLKNS